LDFEVAQMLYGLYAVEHNEYGAVLTGMESYEIPMFDLFIYLNSVRLYNKIK